METNENTNGIFEKGIFHFACFGVTVATHHQQGWLHIDMHGKNILYDDATGDIELIDLKHLRKIEYPYDIDKIASALYTLLRWLPVKYVSAFRHGYLHKSGSLGRMIFDILRIEYNITALGEISEFTYYNKPKQPITISNLELSDTYNVGQNFRNFYSKFNVSSVKSNNEDSEKQLEYINTFDYTTDSKLFEFIMSFNLIELASNYDQVKLSDAFVNYAKVYELRNEIEKFKCCIKYSEIILDKANDYEDLSDYVSKGIMHPRLLISVSYNPFHFLWIIDDCEKGIYSLFNFKQILTKGVNKWNEFRIKNPQIKPILSGINFNSIDLSGINLNKLTISNCDFSNSNLFKADLSESEICNSVFSGANLNEVNFKRVTMRNVSFV